ncbi:MAG: Hpt domain-containing protein [Photobacterium frigidiphilum]|uniref:Hpt domain-containing protein n=1 Tax=Photobacterium frigidiphilum TaxID=264736 RepID=UPI003001DAC5
MRKMQSLDSRRTRQILYVMIVIIAASIVGGSYFSYQSTQALNTISQISSLESEAEQRLNGLLVYVSRLALFNMVLMGITSLLAITSMFTAVKLLTLVEGLERSEVVERSETEERSDTVETHAEEATSVNTNVTKKRDEQSSAVSQDSPQSTSRLDSSEDTILDINYILESMSGDKESVVMLLEIFREEHSADGLRLRELIEGSQIEEALRLVHNLKGVAGSLGAPRLKVESERLEESYLQQKSVTLNDAEKVTNIIYLVVNAINKYLAAEIEGSSDIVLNVEADKNRSSVDISNEASGNTSPLAVDKEPISPELTSKAAIDIPLMLEAMDGDSDSVQMLLDIFTDEHASDAKKLHQLVLQCESTNISEPAIRIVHSLKGVAGSLGAGRLKEIAGVIERKFIQHQVVADAEYYALSLALDECITQAASYITEESHIYA